MPGFKIRGFQEITLIDWDGKIASILYLGGCNFRCGYCHSGGLALDKEDSGTVPFKYIEGFLEKKKGWVDGVVITGGEPTLDKEHLFELIDSIKGLGFLVKLDTNGSNPGAVEELICSNRIDYIAMDIKAPLLKQRYEKATNTPVGIIDVVRSKDMILASDIEYEFRTTVVPGAVGISEIAEIAKSIAPAKKYFIQQFLPRDTLDPSFSGIRPYSEEELDKMASVASEYLPNVIVRRN